jgi:F-type H+-transporting ATPase subunit a
VEENTSVDPITQLGAGAEHLKDALMNPAPIWESGPIVFTQYNLFMVIGLVVTLLVVILVGRKLTLVPQNKFTHMVEYGYQFVRDDMCAGVIGPGFKKHVPIFATMFFFILICNVIGLLPGSKTATGSISCTWALAVISFVYFNYWGVKALGGWHYIKSYMPAGMKGPMGLFLWFLEFVSMILRVLTLAVRLFGNMFAGHMQLGIFALATSIFISTAIANADFLTALPAVAWFALLLFIYALECLIAFLQAYIFTVLSTSYVQMATSDH